MAREAIWRRVPRWVGPSRSHLRPDRHSRTKSKSVRTPSPRDTEFRRFAIWFRFHNKLLSRTRRPGPRQIVRGALRGTPDLNNHRNAANHANTYDRFKLQKAGLISIGRC